MTDKPEGKRWGRGMWALVTIGGVLALWVGGCAVGEAINANKVASVKMGMTPAEVAALLGPPIQTAYMGDGTHEFSYRGFRDRDRIDVTFDGALKVIKVRRYSLPPHWLRHMVG